MSPTKATLSSSRHSVCRNSHHTGIFFAGRLPRLHRAGPSTSLDKSAIGAWLLCAQYTTLSLRCQFTILTISGERKLTVGCGWLC
jgi:hypothetical protein